MVVYFQLQAFSVVKSKWSETNLPPGNFKQISVGVKFVCIKWQILFHEENGVQGF